MVWCGVKWGEAGGSGVMWSGVGWSGEECCENSLKFGGVERGGVGSIFRMGRPKCSGGGRGFWICLFYTSWL